MNQEQKHMSHDDMMQELINKHPIEMDAYRYSQGQIRHLRDAMIELADLTEESAKKVKLERLAISMNTILQSMLVSDQQYIYMKGKLN